MLPSGEVVNCLKYSTPIDLLGSLLCRLDGVAILHPAGSCDLMDSSCTQVFFFVIRKQWNLYQDAKVKEMKTKVHLYKLFHFHLDPGHLQLKVIFCLSNLKYCWGGWEIVCICQSKRVKFQRLHSYGLKFISLMRLMNTKEKGLGLVSMYEMGPIPANLEVF